MSHHHDLSSQSHEDPVDVLARTVPRHIWLSLAVVAVTVLAGLLLFGAPRPSSEEKAAETQTLEGKVLQILSEERILLGGIVLGTAGVLDDVTTNQASVTFQLKRAAPDWGRLELFRHSMVVGRDHIAAVVNTLLLAYVGASLSLLLLVAAQAAPLSQMFSQAFIAEEIIRTLTGSLGLILATPITSLIAGAFVQKEERLKRTASARDTQI